MNRKVTKRRWKNYEKLGICKFFLIFFWAWFYEIIPSNLDLYEIWIFNEILTFCFSEKVETGVMYVGHLPVQFQEPQIRKYFEQFGKIIRLRLSRSKKVKAQKNSVFKIIKNIVNFVTNLAPPCGQI